MAIEQFVPFMSDYKFFEDMGVRVFDNGHSFSGVTSASTASTRRSRLRRAMGRPTARSAPSAILGSARHNTVYYPNLTIKGAIQAIRVVGRSRSTRR